MKPPSSPSDPLFGPLFGSPAVDPELDDRAWLRAMLDVERALAAAQARTELVPAEAAAAIAAATMAAAEAIDPAGLGRDALAAGNPVVPLVRELTALLPPSATPYLHLGATSQDILDTAACLVAARSLRPILADLAAVADQCARLAEAHRHTLMAGRTLTQQALPTTFGLKCAGWLVAVCEASGTLARVRDTRLAVQFGGAAGTLAALGDAGPRVTAGLAEELGLAEPALPWHTNRTRVAELAGALGVASGVLAKIALDVSLLAQTEVAEVAEAAGGGSSAMPHKQNPVRAVLVTAATRRVPGLVATVLSGMAQEHERAAGAWHAEWPTLTDLLRLVGGAAGHARHLLTGLRVDAARMRHNLDASAGLLLAEHVAARLAPALGRTAAHDLVARLSRDAATAGRPLRDALLADPAVRAKLGPTEIDEILDPAGYLGSASEFVDRALALHRDAGRP